MSSPVWYCTHRPSHYYGEPIVVSFIVTAAAVLKMFSRYRSGYRQR
jgi:hypothetical protein